MTKTISNMFKIGLLLLVILKSIEAQNVISVTPEQHSIVATLPEIKIELDFHIDPGTLNDSTVFIKGEFSGLHSISVLSFDSLDQNVTIIPTDSFFNGEKITVTLTNEIKSVNGTRFNPISIYYRTEVDRGNGNFELKSTLYANGIQKVFPAEINGDLYIDLIANTIDSKVLVFTNVGGDSFYISTISQTWRDSSPQLCLGDFDNDEDIDYAFTDEGYDPRIEDYLKVVKNDGFGNFSYMVNNNIGYTNYITAAYGIDYNNDGFDDIALAEMGYSLSIYENIPSNNFIYRLNTGNNYTSYNYTFGDWDNDFDIDVLSFSGLLIKNDIIQFNLFGAIDGNMKDYSFADFNGDTFLDIALIKDNHFVEDELKILLGDGTGIFNEFSSLNLPGEAQSMTIGDFDADNDFDVVVVIKNLNQMNIFNNDGAGNFSLINMISIDEPSVVNSADFDNDGSIDLITINTTTDSVNIFYGGLVLFTIDSTNIISNQIDKFNVEIYFQNAVDTTTINNNTIKIYGEYSGSNSIDYYTTTDYDKLIAIYPKKQFLPGEKVSITFTSGIQNKYGKKLSPVSFQNTIRPKPSDAYFNSTQTILAGTGPFGLASADFDNDGDMDLVVSNREIPNGPQALVLMNDGDGSFFESSILTTESGNVSCTVGDFDNDDDIDIAIGNYWANTISIFENDANGYFNNNISYVVPAKPENIKTADLNNDGYLDLIIACSDYYGSVRYISILENIEGNSFSIISSINWDIDWPYQIEINDFNFDGLLDILVKDDDLFYYLNHGNFAFERKFLLNDPSQSLGLFILNDINYDSYYDIILEINKTGYENKIIFYSNDGQNNYFEYKEIVIESELSFFDSKDLDGDNDIDIIAIFKSNNGKGFILINEGYTNFRKINKSFGGEDFRGGILTDFDEDGDYDLALSNYGGDKVTIFKNQPKRLGIDVDITSIEFNSVIVGNTSKLEFKIYNTGANEELQFDIQATGSEKVFSIDPLFGTIPAQDSSEININFNPKSDSTYSEHLIIHHNDLYNDDIKIDLYGIGVPPKDYILYQNFPNPFNNLTTIRYAVPHDSEIEIILYNILGQNINTIKKGHQKAGIYQIFWNGEDQNGKNVSSGLYFYQLRSKEFSKTKKLLLIK